MPAASDDELSRPPADPAVDPPDEDAHRPIVGRGARVLDRLGRFQVRHPGWLLLIAAVTVALSIMLALRLKLKTSFGELLPRSKESVIIADQVSERIPSMSLLIVVAEGEDNKGLERFVDAAVPELEKIDPKMVARVEGGVHQSLRFVDDNRFLYAPLDLVREVHDEVVSRYDYEVLKRTDAVLDEDPPPPLTEESIKKRIDERTKKDGGGAPGAQIYPDGYYLDAEHHAIAILIRTPIESGDVDESRALMEAVRAAIDRVGPTQYDASIRIGYTGDLIVSAEEYEKIKDDLAHIGVWGVSLILGVVLLYFLRLRTLILMGLTVAVGAFWTFAGAYLLIGYLNTSSGLLVSIVVGNGINFGIIYMARYLEARRTQDVAAAIRTAHRRTWVGTLAAAAAAATAYGSLVVTDFRGFKHFGIIGGTGMLLCWVATYLFLPAMLVVSEWLLPVRHGALDRVRGAFGLPFVWIISKAPRVVTVLGVGITVASAIIAVRFIAKDPIEYDLYNIRNAPVVGESEARRLAGVVSQFVSRQDRIGLAIITDSLDQVLPLKAALEAKRAAAPADKKPFSDVVTIYDLLPNDQDEKIKLIREVVDKLKNAHNKRFVSEEEYAKIRDYLPKKALRPIGIADLPEQMARNFEEKDGTRGRMVYVAPTGGRSIWDAHYLVEWADSLRATTLPDKTVVKASNQQVIFADMFLAVLEDAPRAMMVSLWTTLALIVITFRGRRPTFWVLGSLAFGLLTMVAVLALWPTPGDDPSVGAGLRLNFLNFIALPITVGVGSDYAINIVQRYRAERAPIPLDHPSASGRSYRDAAGRNKTLYGYDIVRSVAETGGALVLCSLTTMLGYFALTLSVNLAVRSFGIAAAVGEISCILGAVLVLPAILAWRETRRRARALRALQAERAAEAARAAEEPEPSAS